MSRISKTFALFLTLTIAMSCLTLLTVKPADAQDQGITINSDGSITPSSAPIQRVGDTYYLTSNLAETITIQRSNCTFNGNGYEITGNYSTMYGFLIGTPIYGFMISSVTNVTLENTIINNCPVGILLYDTSNVTVVNNTVRNQISVNYGDVAAAISVSNSISDLIQGNSLQNDSNGVYLESYNHAPCFDNLIVGNNFTDCYTLFTLYGSSNNQIYHNNFVGYSRAVLDIYYDGYGVASQNIWDNGYPSGGNYWGLKTGTEIGNTGISNASYKVNAYGENVYPNNVDRYPLIDPFSLAFLVNYESEVVPPEVSVLSPSNRTYSDVNVSLSFAIDKPFNWVGYSFDGQDNVTVSGNTTIADVTYGLHDVTVYANSTFGIMGASNPVLFTVSKPEAFPALTVAIISIAGIAVLSFSLLIYRRHRKTANLNKLNWK